MGLNIRIATGVLGVLAVPALAHDGAGAAAPDLLAAFLHPFGGLDHLAAFVVVGVWAARTAGAMRAALPLAFVLGMSVGALLWAHAGGPLLGEAGIACSLLILGLAVALGLEPPRAATLALVAACAVSHGAAHGRELLAHGGGVGLCAAFLAATILLHAAGYALGRAAAGGRVLPLALRAGAGALAVAGAWTLLAA